MPASGDDSGGAIVTWQDNRTSGETDIYAQRVKSDGTIATGWTANGVALRSGVTGTAYPPTITSDGSGGAIVTWQDTRPDVNDIYAQRVNSSGAAQWTANGVVLRSIAGSDAQSLNMTSDGSGGAIVTWQDLRSGDGEIYAQRVNSAGAAQWTGNGVALRSIAGSGGGSPTVTSDGTGGAIVTWYDNRSGEWDIFAQRVDSTGTPRWTANGVALRTSEAGTSATYPTITSDGTGGAIVTWQDNRSGVNDPYAQRVDSTGTPRWTANGVALRSILGTDGGSPTITSDGSGGAIVTWQDNRNGQTDIYAQRVTTIYSVTVTQGVNGTIAPPGTAGVVTVDSWADQTFNITPAAHYYVASLTVDGAPVPPASSYTFHTVTDDHTIAATFAITTHNITVTQGANGAIVPPGTAGVVTVNDGVDQTFNITPTAHYHIATLTVGGAPVTPASSYTFHNVIGDHSIAATFAITTHTITASAGANGTISPSGPATVNDGAGKTFTITANAGYHIDTLTVDGSPVTPASSYTFHGVTANHTITATFASDSSTWYLAEGSTAWGFDDYISIENPNTTAVHATITYMTGSGNV